MRGAALFTLSYAEVMLVQSAFFTAYFTVSLPAAALGVVAAVVWRQRRRLTKTPAQPTGLLQALGLLRRPRFGFGALCIFLYVGAEVAIGSLIVNYLMQTGVLGLAEQDAGKRVPFYWAGALVGRFIGGLSAAAGFPGEAAGGGGRHGD